MSAAMRIALSRGIFAATLLDITCPTDNAASLRGLPTQPTIDDRLTSSALAAADLPPRSRRDAAVANGIYVAIFPDVIEPYENETQVVTCWANYSSVRVYAIRISVNGCASCDWDEQISLSPQEAGALELRAQRSFIATQQWNGASILCSASTTSGPDPNPLVAKKTVQVREAPALVVSPASTMFVYLERVAMSCSLGIRQNGATVHWSVLDCANCERTAAEGQDGGPAWLNFTATAAWSNARVQCVDSVYSRTRPVALIITGVPTLTVAAESATTWSGTLQRLSCQAKGGIVFSLDHPLQWNVTCLTAAGCAYTVGGNNTFKTLTFNATPSWADATVFCRVSGDRDLYSSHAVRLRDIPAIEIQPPVVSSYNLESHLLKCRSNSSYVKAAQLRWQWAKGFNPNSNLTEGVVTDGQYSTLLVLADVSMNEQSIECSFSLGANPQTTVRQSFRMLVYDTPTLSLEQLQPSYPLQSNVTIVCRAAGFVIGGLKWSLSCKTCLHEAAFPDYVSDYGKEDYSDSSKDGLSRSVTLSFVAYPVWQGAQAMCHVADRKWLNVTATITVMEAANFDYIGWLVIPLCVGLSALGLAIAAVVYYRTAKRWTTLREARAKRKAERKEKRRLRLEKRKMPRGVPCDPTTEAASGRPTEACLSSFATDAAASGVATSGTAKEDAIRAHKHAAKLAKVRGVWPSVKKNQTAATSSATVEEDKGGAPVPGEDDADGRKSVPATAL